MINIRNGIFETNSSSVHTLCISKANDYEIPEHIYFRFGEYGWETRIIGIPEGRANYLYTAFMLYSDDPEDYKNWIYETLGKHGCEAEFENPKGMDVWDCGYIDHGWDLEDFLHDIRHSEKRLMRYLFGDSFILTGNDNDAAYLDVLEDMELDNVEQYKK